MSEYEPPYDRTPTILRLVAEISECSARYTAFSEHTFTPQLHAPVLEIEDPDPWVQDNEPIFWTD